MPLFVVVFLKRMSYNKETKREVEKERQENKGSQSRDKKAITADSAPDPNNQCFYFFAILKKTCELSLILLFTDLVIFNY